MAFISIEQNGEIHRCIRLKENLGHVATGVQLYKMPQPCPITRCPCWGQYLLVDREKVQKTAAAFVIPTAKEWLLSRIDIIAPLQKAARRIKRRTGLLN